jgi:transposase
MVARLAAELVAHVRALTEQERALEREVTTRVVVLAPSLLALAGVDALTAAKVAGEVADVRRFKSKDAFARHSGSALPVWSGNRQRRRLSRTCNRQLSAAIHPIAVTQKRCQPAARAFLERRLTSGNTRTEALRARKRRLSDIVYRALLADAQPRSGCLAETA